MTSQTRRVLRAPAVVWIALASLICYLLYVAVRLEVDYFDAYEVLWHAQSIADLKRPLGTLRALLVPVLFAPLLAVQKLVGVDDFGFRACHVASVTAFALTLIVFYRMLRLHLDRAAAALATLLLAINPLLIHYAPHARDDLPAMLLTTSAFYFYLRSTIHETPARLILAGTFMGLAMGARYNLIVLIIPVVVAHQILSGSVRTDRKRLMLKILTLLALPCFTFFLVPMVIFPLTGRGTVLEAPLRYLHDIYRNSQLFKTYAYQSGWQNYVFLFKSMTPLVFVCAAAGILVGWTRRRGGVLFHSVWLILFFIPHTYVLSTKEARYLFPLLPPLYFFAAVGFEALRDMVPRWWRRGAPAVAVVLLLAWPLYTAARECIKFRDPLYTTAYTGPLSRYAAQLAGHRMIYWLGPYYGIHPREFVFHPEDEFTYIYHFHTHVVQFYTRKDVRELKPVGTAAPGAASASVVDLAVFPQLQDGDVIIINPEPSLYDTRSAPQFLKPLTVRQIRLLSFIPSDEGKTFTSVQAPGSAVQLASRDDAGWRVEAHNLPDGNYACYFELGESLPMPLGHARAIDGRFILQVPPHIIPSPPHVSRILLLGTAQEREFLLPGHRHPDDI